MINEQNVGYFDLDIELVYNKIFTESIDNVRMVYKGVFGIVRSMLEDNYLLIEAKEQNEAEIGLLKNNIEELRESIIILNHDHQTNLGKLREEMLERCYNYGNGVGEEQEYNANTFRKVEEKDKKTLEKKIIDLTKSNSKLCQ